MTRTGGGPYQLGVDLGCASTKAATAADGDVKILELGDRGAAMPSIVYVGADGTFSVGHAAARRAHSEPDRVAHDIAADVGSSSSRLVGGVPCSADRLLAELLQGVLHVAERTYSAVPSHVVLSHPMGWSPYQLDAAQQAARMAGCPSVGLVPEPAAAVTQLAQERDLGAATRVLVYDHGGTTASSTVVQWADGVATALEGQFATAPVGGAALDELMYRHVLARAGVDEAGLDRSDPMVASTLRRLLDECRDAREALSAVGEVSLPVMVPGTQANVVVTVGDLEVLIADAVEHGLGTLSAAMGSSGTTWADIDLVLAVGGNTSTPLVRRRLGEVATGRLVDGHHPDQMVALGAAAVAAREAAALAPVADVPPVPVAQPGPAPAVAVAQPGPTTAADGTFEPVAPSAPATPPASGSSSQRGRWVWIAAAAAAVLALVGVAALILSQGRSDNGSPEDESAPDPAAATSVPAEPTTVPDVDDPAPLPEATPIPPDEGEAEADPAEPISAVGEPIRTIAIGAGPDQPLEIDGILWISNADDGTVARLDPVTGVVEPISVGANPDTALFAEGSLWVPTRDDDQLARLDVADQSVTRIDVGPNADTPVFAAGHIWVPVRDARRMLVIDPATNAVVVEADLAGRPLTPLVDDNNGLWFVTRDDNSLNFVDLMAFVPGQPLSIQKIAVGADPDRPILADGLMWVPNRDDASISVLDPATRTVIATVAVGERPDTPVATPGLIWVSNVGADSVSVIDIASRSVVAELMVGAGPRTGVASSTHVWVPARAASVVVGLSIADRSVEHVIPTGAAPDTPAIIGDRLWVPSGGAGLVVEIFAG